MSALIRTAASSVNRQRDEVQSIRKLAEGGFNIVFELTMRDGFQFIARLPHPSIQPKPLATASEVATMDLVRGHGVPTPTVYGYSATAENEVGAEYVILEKVPGRCLSDIWFELSDKERVRILGEIVDQEVRLFNISFPAYGSIYYPEDLPEDMPHFQLQEQDRSFCIGPDVSLKHWFGTRSQLDITRGPATTAQQVLENAARKEAAWLREYGRPRLPFDREYREMFRYQKVHPDEHLRSLEMFEEVAAHILPEQVWLHRPILRHPDLKPNNIFVDEDCKITGIIDWQHSIVLPLFLHAGIPASLQNYGDPDSEGLNKPELPSNIDEMDEEDRRKDLELYRRRHTHFYYVGATAAKLDAHYAAMSHDQTLFRKRIYQHAAEPWEGNEIPLIADLVRLAKDWSELTHEPDNGESSFRCPISFNEGEAEDIINKAVEQEDTDRRMQILRDVIATSSDGWMSFEGYEEAVAQVAAMTTTALGYAESELERDMTEQHWPFDDFDEDG